MDPARNPYSQLGAAFRVLERNYTSSLSGIGFWLVAAVVASSLAVFVLKYSLALGSVFAALAVGLFVFAAWLTFHVYVRHPELLKSERHVEHMARILLGARDANPDLDLLPDDPTAQGRPKHLDDQLGRAVRPQIGKTSSGGAK
jgi:hypothetical protein